MLNWLSRIFEKRAHSVTSSSAIEQFFHDLIKQAPPAGEGAYAFMADDGACRGWIQLIVDSPSSVVLHRLWTLQPGKGNGAFMLKSLCALADQHQVEVILKPLPFGRKPYRFSVEELAGWYARHGFVGTDRRMVRKPSPHKREGPPA